MNPLHSIVQGLIFYDNKKLWFFKFIECSLMLPTHFDDVDGDLSHLSDHNVGKIFRVFIILTMIL